MSHNILTNHVAAPTVTHVCNHKTHGLRFVFCSGTKHKSESLFLCFKYELQVRLVCNQHLLSWKHTACLETLVYQKFLTINGSFKPQGWWTWSTWYSYRGAVAANGGMSTLGFKHWDIQLHVGCIWSKCRKTSQWCQVSHTGWVWATLYFTLLFTHMSHPQYYSPQARSHSCRNRLHDWVTLVSSNIEE